MKLLDDIRHKVENDHVTAYTELNKTLADAMMGLMASGVAAEDIAVAQMLSENRSILLLKGRPRYEVPIYKT